MNFEIKKKWQKLKNILGVSLSFAKANFKVRNEGSHLGILWYLLEPLLFLFIILSIRGLAITEEIEFYPVYLFLGLIMFNFFMNVTNIATNSIQSNSKFVKNTTLSRESLVIAIPFQFILSHIIEITVLVILMLIYKVSLATLIFYPFIFLALLIFTLGISFILATLGVFINDLKNLWAVFTRLLWFATPIYYAANFKGSISIINYLNPLTHFLNIARDVVIYQKSHFLVEYLLIITLSLIFLLIGIFAFEKYKSKFAEEM
ncbi:MAG: ABC transporter permease [archaeon]